MGLAMNFIAMVNKIDTEMLIMQPKIMQANVLELLLCSSSA